MTILEKMRKMMAERILTNALEIYRRSFNNKFQKFIKENQIDDKTKDKFQMGYAAETNVITNYLLKIVDPLEREESIKLACELQLIRPSKSSESSYYDVFFDRIMMPIMDLKGKPCGFIGIRTHAQETASEQSVAKYYISSESFHFKKRNVLAGLHQAQNAITEKNFVLIVEDYLDLIKLHQNGITNSVALMGVTMSEEVIKYLKNLTINFTLGLDLEDATRQIRLSLNSHDIITKSIGNTPLNGLNELNILELQQRLNDGR